MPPSSSELANRLLSLRQILKQYPHIAAYTLRTSDAHNSEYLAERDKRIAFISGFTGSNGAIIVTEKEALLWTDGRYFAQAEKELDASLWRLMKMGVPGFPTREEWLAQNLKSNEKVAFDTDLITITEYNGLVKHLTDNGAEGVNAVPLSKSTEHLNDESCLFLSY
ncbi:hypothetical protein ACOME3_008119 [Neoechinorhynchus agilis]